MFRLNLHLSEMELKFFLLTEHTLKLIGGIDHHYCCAAGGTRVEGGEGAEEEIDASSSA